MKTHDLTITYTTSRGRETYGYGLVTLRERGEVKAKTCGGGYDMRGTVFATWLQDTYSARLLELAKKRRNAFLIQDWDGEHYRLMNGAARTDLYGGTYYRKPRAEQENGKGYVTLDGGCGFSSIQRIAEAIGLTVRTVDDGKNRDVIIVTDTRAA